MPREARHVVRMIDASGTGYLHRGLRRLRVLADVREALRDEVEGRHLELLGQALVHVDGQAHGQRRAGGELLQPHREAVAADHRRVEAARDVSQLLE